MIKVLLFSHLREDMGKNSIVIDKEQMSIKEVKEYISGLNANCLLQNVVAAVNEEYSEDDRVVGAGDTVALIPPVGGG